MDTNENLDSVSASNEENMSKESNWVDEWDGRTITGIVVSLIFVLILIILAVYILRVLLPGIEKAGAKGPSPEMAKLHKRQMIISIISFITALLVLLFTAVTSVI